jgi:hypothetical protein
MSQDPDSLTASSRSFYERSKAKLALSVVIAAGGLMILGFCSIAGGESASNSQLKELYPDDDHIQYSFQALVSGYGFAAFVYILAFLLLMIAAFYISPYICGTTKEKNMIRSPSENHAYASYDDSGSKI